MPLPTTGLEYSMGVALNPDWVTERELDLVAAAFRWARLDLSWSSVERTRENFGFEQHDAILDALEARGMGCLFVLAYGAASAAYSGIGLSTTFTPPTTPEQQRAWVHWVQTCVERYKGRDVAWEVWNEPYSPGWWGGVSSPEQYADLCRLTAAAIHDVDPDATVVGGGGLIFYPHNTSVVSGGVIRTAVASDPLTGPWATDYVNRFINAGGLEGSDVVSLHPYRDHYPPEQLTEDASMAALSSLPQWFTEYSWTLGWARRYVGEATQDRHDDHDADVTRWYAKDNVYYSEDDQANYLARMFLFSAMKGVDKTFWYNWRDFGTASYQWPRCLDPEHDASRWPFKGRWDDVGTSMQRTMRREVNFGLMEERDAARLDNWSVGRFVITGAGSGITMPTATVDGGVIAGDYTTHPADRATVKPVVRDGRVIDLIITSSGSGYSFTPRVTVNPVWGTELIETANWSVTGGAGEAHQWTADAFVTLTHVVDGGAHTATLLNSVAAIAARRYRIEYTVTGRTAGTISIEFGGQTKTSISATGTWEFTAKNTNSVVITPDSNFDGTIVVSIKAGVGYGADYLPTINGGKVVYVTQRSAGCYYPSPRVLTRRGGGGSGFVPACGAPVAGSCTSVYIVDAGRDYEAPPGIRAVGGYGDLQGIYSQTFTATLSGDTVAAVADAGPDRCGYLPGPSADCTHATHGGAGDEATAVVMVQGDKVCAVIPTALGAGYGSEGDELTIPISPGTWYATAGDAGSAVTNPGTGAIVIGIVDAAGGIGSYRVEDGGSYYIAPPEVEFTGGITPTGDAPNVPTLPARAHATVGVELSVTSIELLSGGKGYTAAPAVTVVPNGTVEQVFFDTAISSDGRTVGIDLTDATGGTYTLTYGGQTTAALPWNARAAAVQAALEGLSSVGAGNMVCGGGHVTVEGLLTFVDAPFGQQLTIDAAGLTGTGAVGKVLPIAADRTKVAIYIANATGGTFTLSYNNAVTTETTGALAYDATADTIQTALRALANIAGANVLCGTTEVTVTGAGTLLYTDLSTALTIDDTSVTGGADVAGEIVTGVVTSCSIVNSSNTYYNRAPRLDVLAGPGSAWGECEVYNGAVSDVIVRSSGGGFLAVPLTTPTAQAAMVCDVVYTNSPTTAPTVASVLETVPRAGELKPAYTAAKALRDIIGDREYVQDNAASADVYDLSFEKDGERTVRAIWRKNDTADATVTITSGSDVYDVYGAVVTATTSVTATESPQYVVEP